jgi:nicotinamide mononucleotide (NMN) deamidase PncC
MSSIRATTISDLAGTGPATLTGQYAAKAWVNFNGTGTPAIRESGNVSSTTDNDTGNYSINFATAMLDANYAVSGSTVGSSETGVGGPLVSGHPTRSSFIIYNFV